jgi:hypothetical protein
MLLLKVGVVVGIAYFGNYCSKSWLKVGLVEPQSQNATPPYKKMSFQMQETKTTNAYFMIQMQTLQVW